ncbi:MAG: hypothetical protein OXF55_12500 [Caldilineaceae bacterium]|nr:hypothetical protein [Caldilineaceae bacterium]
MKRPYRKKFPLLVALTLALLLAVALAGTALANPPGGHVGPGGNGPGNQQPGNNGPQDGHVGPGGSGPGNQQSVNNGPGTGSNGPGSGEPGNMAPAPTATPTPAPSAAHPDAPSTPSGDCIVSHAATPAQLCPVAGGLQYYFIGSDGSSSIGPHLSPFSELATLYTVGTSVQLYNGINPLTSKSVQIDYLPSESKIRVSTYYPDTQYDTNKPYTFTVDTSNSVTHEAW